MPPLSIDQIKLLWADSRVPGKEILIAPAGVLGVLFVPGASNVCLVGHPVSRRAPVETFERRWEEAGQGLAEYALILALIAIAAVVALMFLSGAITAILNQIGNSL